MDKNTILAFVLIAVIIILMPYYEKWLYPEMDSPQAQTVQQDTQAVKQPDVDPEPVQPRPDPIVPKAASFDEKHIVIENSKYILRLSSTGGGTVKEYIFKEYFDFEGQPLSLLPEKTGQNLGLTFTNVYQDETKLESVVFSSPQLASYSNNDTIRVTSDMDITFEAVTADGVAIRKNFTFYPNEYDMKLDVTFSDYLRHVAPLSYDIIWEDGFIITEKSTSDDLMYSGVYAMMGTEMAKVESRRAKNDMQKNISSTGRTDWMLWKSKYFSGFIIPVSNKGIRSNIAITKGSESRDFDMALGMKLDKSNYHTDSFIVGIVPMKKRLLSSYDVELEKTMNWGGKIIKPFSIAFLWLMQQLYKIIPNYGFVLIIISILIKIVTFPLTQKSYESSKKMQLLQPKLKELQKKYANNKQVLQEKTMELYKKENVSMLGGCLPLLIQMPLLWGLFIVFRTAIELRGAPFIFWIQDLSGPDAMFTFPFSIPLLGTEFNLLPILMTVLMVVQQKLSGTGASAGGQQAQQQKMMMWLMPLMMFFLFYRFPSGLNLYYFMFNLLTILQQKFIVNKVVERKFVESHPGGKNLKKV